MKRTGLWIALGVVAFIVLIVYSTMSLGRHRVEVCMQFAGRQACRTASGETEEKARAAAIANACALISSGVTDTIACQGSRPVSMRILD